MQELLVFALAQTDALAKLLIEKALNHPVAEEKRRIRRQG